jgi:hypothetical protein
MLLFPAHPLSPSLPDDHFLPEWEAARVVGVETALFDDEQLRRGQASLAVRTVSGKGQAFLRSWMLLADEYRSLEEALSAQGVTLSTSADDYARAHHLPGWYDAFREHTARSICLGPNLDGLEEALTELAPGAAVIKDHVKSLKHLWAEAAFIPDVEDAEAARRVCERFLEVRAEDLVGSLVIREWEDYETAEVRSWWVGDQLALITAHPDNQDLKVAIPHLEFLVPAVTALACPFITVDLARRSDRSSWRVVEVGDAQVSDCPPEAQAVLAQVVLSRITR